MFNASYFTSEKTDLDKGEQFSNPDYARTMDIKRDATYEYTENGFIKEGTLVKKGYVLVSKTAKITKPTNQFLYVDRSIVYKKEEPVFADKVISPRDDQDVLTAKVRLRADRPLIVGDKLSCLTDDHEVLTKRGWISIADVTLDDEVACLYDDYLTYDHPTALHKYDHDGEMYHIRSMYIDLFTTMNHRMYVSKAKDGEFMLEEAQNIVGKQRYYKKNAEWVAPDIPTYTVKYTHSGKITGGAEWPDIVFDMNDWLTFLGIWIGDGNLVKANHCQVQVTCTKERKIAQLQDICRRMGFKLSSHGKNHYIYSSQIYKALKPLNVGAPNKYLPEYVFEVSKSQARILLDALISTDGSINKSTGNITYCTSSKRLANDVTRLIVHCGWSGYMYVDRPAGHQSVVTEKGVRRTITTKHDSIKISLNKSNNTPRVNSNGKTHDSIVKWAGKVYCISVESEVFLVRRNGRIAFTGNSRSGNKGICSKMVPRTDMPYCEDGLVPDLIVNAHSIPTRMAINQIIECMMAQLAAEKGCVLDATSFRKIDIDGIIADLKTHGIDFAGHRRMYNGKTGDWIDTLVFIGPTTYQRLQKFVINEHYASRTGPTSALTRQPLDGKANQGGLKIGEMEKDTIAAHGTMRMLFDKFNKDSDGITMHICRMCGNRAIVNEQTGIYKCKYCGDNADIVSVESTWVANLFFNEASAMNIKMNFDVQPFVYQQREQT